MLAPGEYLTKPVPPPESAPPADRDAVPTPPPAPPEDTESQTFLMILLRALGTFHC